MMSQNALISVVALIALTLGVLGGHALSDPPVASPSLSSGPVPFSKVLQSGEADRLRAMVIMNTESRFEKVMHLVAPFDNCETKGDMQFCTALTEARTLVAYHCTIDRCEMDCSAP